MKEVAERCSEGFLMSERILFLKLKDYTGKDVWIVNNVAYDYNPFANIDYLTDMCPFLEDDSEVSESFLFDDFDNLFYVDTHIQSSFLPVVTE